MQYIKDNITIKRINLGTFSAGTYNIKNHYVNYQSLTNSNFAVIVTSTSCWHDNSDESAGSQSYSYNYNNSTGLLTISFTNGGNTHAHMSCNAQVYLYVPQL